jgi:hypothetical protein
MKQYVVLIIALSLVDSTYAGPYCLTDREGTKAVLLQPVACDCVCARYKHVRPKNQCVKCDHYQSRERVYEKGPCGKKGCFTQKRKTVRSKNS